MRQMTEKDYQRQIEILDRRITELTNLLPSREILHAAETIRSANIGDYDEEGTFTGEDYQNLVSAHYAISEFLPPILRNIRAHAIDPESGWRFEEITNGFGDFGLCAICDEPFQHFRATVKVHTQFMHDGSFHGVCRDCVGYYAPLEFSELSEVDEWRQEPPNHGDQQESDHKTEEQRCDLIDAIRRHALETNYFGEIVQAAPEWAQGAFGEWR